MNIFWIYLSNGHTVEIEALTKAIAKRKALNLYTDKLSVVKVKQR